MKDMKYTDFLKKNEKAGDVLEFDGDKWDKKEPDEIINFPDEKPKTAENKGMKKVLKKGKDGKEKEVEVKSFNVGDVITLVDTKKSTKMPGDAYDFLMTYKTFTVKKVTEKGNLDLGCHISKNEPDGTGVEKVYLFGPNRFELKEAAPEGYKPVETEDDDEPAGYGPGFPHEDAPPMDIKATVPGFKHEDGKMDIKAGI